MQIFYDSKTDLLYIRLDESPQEIVNRRISDDVVLDIGAGDIIVGIEIVDASHKVNLDKVLPVKYRAEAVAA